MKGILLCLLGIVERPGVSWGNKTYPFDMNFGERFISLFCLLLHLDIND